MFHLSSSKLFLKLAALCLLVACLVYVSNRAASTRRGAAPRQVLTVQAEPQPESPLQITSTKVLSSDPFSPSVELTVTNKGSKGIRAYAVTYELVAEGGSRKTALFTHLASQRNVLQPGQSRSESINESYSPAFISSVVLAVDFVESEDGKTWGKDAFNSADRLAGQRAGGDKALGHFRKVREEKGPSSLLEAVTSEVGAVELPEGRSPEWQDGFKTGVSLVRLRLNRAKQGGGLEGVEEELRKPFDAKEGRPK